MNRQKFIYVFFLFFILNITNTSMILAQSKIGAWYVYLYKHEFNESNFGIQGDLQYHDWEIASDLGQFIVRSGFTFSPKNNQSRFVLGYAYVLNGKQGKSKEIVHENRIYEEVLLPQKVGKRFYFAHRFRYEQRFVENQDFRTRFRYNLVLNVPLNKNDLEFKSIYLSFYNELFFNGEKNIGNGEKVEHFDRNRTYFGLGYAFEKNIKFQLGWLLQNTNRTHSDQIQMSMLHSF